MTLVLLIIIAIVIYYFFIYKDSFNTSISNENYKKCPNCGSGVEDNFNICPICKETLKKKCTNCGRIVDVLWNFCPYCEKPITKGGNK